ncbi:gastric triacylglycerol lipase-like [Corticium candelabrum]|uniref:gastric triacylglycerol lipase-like n=1 Tax=Corticium candelabrum TaxID=121492 RepID=UPI002E26B181|nr:gastric triacylglycerol lipase-like [Corticium candelabrum]
MMLSIVFVLSGLFLWARAANPEENMSASEIIHYHGYPEEDHWVVTEDGFILGMQRIPHGKGGSQVGQRPPFFLQHGLLCSSTVWLTNTEKRNLAFLLADSGFDVWLGNIRGNTYSTNHTKLSPKDKIFWSWSFDEMARYDIPAMLYYVMNHTNQSEVFYAGHSQGTIIAFAGFSINPELASHVKTFYALAPVARVSHIEGLLKYLSYFTPEIDDLFKLFGEYDFLPNDELMKLFAQYFCPEDVSVCSNVLFLICGYDKSDLNETRVPIYLSHTPAGTSVQNMVHLSQEIRSGLFQMYDYGSKEKNAAHYGGKTVPPVYNLTDFHVPMYAYSGTKDFLANPVDVAWLMPQLDSLLKHIVIDNYDHLDFIWGIDAADKVYSHVIATANQRITATTS